MIDLLVRIAKGISEIPKDNIVELTWGPINLWKYEDKKSVEEQAHYSPEVDFEEPYDLLDGEREVDEFYEEVARLPGIPYKAEPKTI